MKSIKNIQFYRDPAIKGIEVSKVESTRHVFPKHAHDDIFALSLITSGASYCIGRENSDLIVSKGEIVLLNPGQVHSGIPINDQPLSYWMLYADIDTMINLTGDIFEKPGILPEFNRMVIRDAEVAGHFINTLQAFENQQDRLEKETLLHIFLTSLLHKACETRVYNGPQTCGNTTIENAKDCLSRDLDMGISLESVAQEVGFSRFHFIRQFKRYTGISPHQFRIQQRIQAAKDLIKKGLPFSEVALETGFSDQSHFTNKFRQYTGATPSQYAHL